MSSSGTPDGADASKAPQLAGKAARLRVELLLAQADGGSAEMRARLVSDLTAVLNELMSLQPMDEQASDFDHGL